MKSERADSKGFRPSRTFSKRPNSAWISRLFPLRGRGTLPRRGLVRGSLSPLPRPDPSASSLLRKGKLFFFGKKRLADSFQVGIIKGTGIGAIRLSPVSQDKRCSFMKKVLFILNPFAGQRRANRRLADILLEFSQAGYEILTHMTTGSGDAAEAVRRWGGRVDLIVCCGGDGTLNETVSGLLQSGLSTPVGYIPAGTTNDFASSLNLSGNVIQAARDILEGEPVAYDVGRFGDRYFTYVASFGAFTKSSYVVPQNIKNALGHTAYVLGGISEISQIRKEHIRMEIDGQMLEDDFLFGAICNSTSIGGILNLDPKQVDMGDGLFEILLVRTPRSLAEISECIQAVQSQKYSCEMITFRSARHIRVWADPNMPWTLDGEREEGHGEVTVENLHHAVQLVQKRSAHD